MDDHLFLPRAEIKALRAELHAIPALMEELAVTITRQDRTRRPGPSARPVPDSRPPLSLEAQDAADELHAELVGWVRLVCEHRGLTWSTPTPAAEPVAWQRLAVEPGTFVGPLRPQDRRAPVAQPPRPPSTATLAGWLARYIDSLAMTPGAEMAYTEISEAVAACRAAIDLPPEDVIAPSRSHLREARRMVMTLDQLAKVAAQIGEAGQGLTHERLKTLVRGRHLRACGQDLDTGTHFYRLGAALEAHAKCPTRKASS